MTSNRAGLEEEPLPGSGTEGLALPHGQRQHPPPSTLPVTNPTGKRGAEPPRRGRPEGSRAMVTTAAPPRSSPRAPGASTMSRLPPHQPSSALPPPPPSSAVVFVGGGRGQCQITAPPPTGSPPDGTAERQPRVTGSTRAPAAGSAPPETPTGLFATTQPGHPRATSPRHRWPRLPRRHPAQAAAT